MAKHKSLPALVIPYTIAISEGRGGEGRGEGRWRETKADLNRNFQPHLRVSSSYLLSPLEKKPEPSKGKSLRSPRTPGVQSHSQVLRIQWKRNLTS